MPATAESWNSITAWLDGAEKFGSDGEAEVTPVSGDGPRGAENRKDTKAVVGGNSVEDGPANPDSGRADTGGDAGGLKQTTADRSPEAVKTIGEESTKIAAADLDDPAQLDAAFESLLKAAAEIPVILARATGRPVPKGAAGKSAPPTPEAAKAARDQARAVVVDRYSKYGRDHADLAYAYFNAFWDGTGALKQAADDGTLEQMLMAESAANAGGGEGGAGGEMPPGAGAPVDAPPPGGGEGGPPDAEGAPGVDDHAAAAAELGISPQELEQLIMLLKQKAQEQGADGGGGLTPPEKEAVDRVLTKAAYVTSEIKARMRGGNFRLKPAADGTPERARRDTAAAFFGELLKAAQDAR